MFTTTSVQAAFYPVYSKLRHRFRARHVSSSPTLQSPYQTIYFSTPYYEVEKKNPVDTVHPEATFIEVLVDMRLDFSSNTILCFFYCYILNDADSWPRWIAMFEI